MSCKLTRMCQTPKYVLHPPCLEHIGSSPHSSSHTIQTYRYYLLVKAYSYDYDSNNASTCNEDMSIQMSHLHLV